MLKKRMDGHFLDYPICCLSYLKGEQQKLKDVAFYCVVECAYKRKEDYKIIGRIKNADFSFVKAKDFNLMEGIHYHIAIAAQDLGVEIDSFIEALKCWGNKAVCK